MEEDKCEGPDETILSLRTDTFSFRDLEPGSPSSADEGACKTPCPRRHPEEKAVEKGLRYFEETPCDLQGEHVEAFDIKVKADVVMVVDSLMAIHSRSGTTVYKWDRDLRLRKTRVIRHGLLQFLVDTGNVSKSTALVLMRLLLSLVANNVRRCELFLENVLDGLGIQDVRDMRIVDGRLHCLSRSFVESVYDEELRLVRRDPVPNEMAEADAQRVRCGDVEVRVEGGFVVIDRARSFVERIKIGKVKQLMPFENHLFVLTEENIKVLRFSE